MLIPVPIDFIDFIVRSGSTNRGRTFVTLFDGLTGDSQGFSKEES
jgi:hypothetical protein